MSKLHRNNKITGAKAVESYVARVAKASSATTLTTATNPANPIQFNGFNKPSQRHTIAQQFYQHGYIALLMILLLTLSGTALFGVLSQDLVVDRKQQLTEKTYRELAEVKRRLMLYAVFFPDIMATDETTPSIMTSITTLPSPGYLPCPDRDRDAEGKADSDCGNRFVAGDASSGFVIGFLPTAVTLRHQYFSGYQPQTPQKFYYVLDEHLAYKNAFYNDISGAGPRRYAPLTLTRNISGNLVFADGAEPILRLNGDGQAYVALLIMPGSAYGHQQRAGLLGFANESTVITQYLEGENANLDNRFYSAGKVSGDAVNDIVIGITAEEWMQQIAQRVCAQYPSFIRANSTGLNVAGDALQPFWFNDYHATENPTGSGFRSLIANGTIECGL